MNNLFTLFLFIFSVVQLNGQRKYEKEVDLSIDQVPTIAKDFIGFSDEDIAVDWYYEYNLIGNSIEAKFCYHKKKYSVEFDTIGMLQDIEVEIRKSKIPKYAKSEIEYALNQEFEKFKIIRIQEHFDASQYMRSFQSFITTDRKQKPTYELEVKGKKKDGFQMYEIVFSHSGSMIRKEVIVQPNTDHFEY